MMMMNTDKLVTKSQRHRNRTLQLMGCSSSSISQCIENECMSSLNLSSTIISVDNNNNNDIDQTLQHSTATIYDKGVLDTTTMYDSSQQNSNISIRKNVKSIEPQFNNTLTDDIIECKQITQHRRYYNITIIAICASLLICLCTIITMSTSPSLRNKYGVRNNVYSPLLFDVSIKNIKSYKLCENDVQMITTKFSHYDRIDIVKRETNLICDFDNPFAVTTNISRSTCLTCSCWLDHNIYANDIPSVYYVIADDVNQSMLSIVLVSNKVIPKRCRLFF